MSRTNPETLLTHAIQDAVRKSGRGIVWRNNVGRAKYGNAWVTYGLAPGSADLVGMCTPSGRALAIEVKLPDHHKAGDGCSPEQSAWRGVWERSGGCYVLATSVAEALCGIGGGSGV